MLTLANKITIARLLLIPVFVYFAVQYGAGLKAGAPDETKRLIAVIIFAVAAISDGLDGFIARHFNQKSDLGAFLDPIADKVLLNLAILTLTFAPWEIAIPLWFTILVFLRDTIILSGVRIIKSVKGAVKMGPHWTSKVCTALQMVAVCWVLLNITRPDPLAAIYAAALFTLISGVYYLIEGIRQLRSRHDADVQQPEATQP